jgi:hypothetical protein
MKLHNLLILLAAVLLCTAPAEAKWWIFGQANEEVSVNYLYLNKVSYDESGPKVTLYRESLTNGLVTLTGKASARAGKIARVRVTVNNKETWEKAKLSDNGAFEFSFRPDEGKAVTMFVEIADSAGKTNDVDTTRKEIVLSDQSMQGAVREALDGLIAAYKAEDGARFRSYIGEDFVNDSTVLDNAVRKDFSSFDHIDLRYTLNNVASGAGGIYVSLNYNRTVTSSRTGQTFSDKGTTEFVFRIGENGPKIYSMKAPLIFGLCNASDVLNGVVTIASTDQVAVCDANGNVSLMSFQDAVKADWGAEPGSALGQSATVDTNPPVTFESFDFAFDSVATEIWATRCTGGITGHFGAYGVNHHLSVKTGVTVVDMGIMSINSVTAAPGGGYVNPNATCAPNSTFLLQQGHVYAFKLPGTAHALIEVTGFNGNKTNFKYKYNPTGSSF